MSNKIVVSVYICNLLCLISQVGQNSRGGYYLLGFLKDPSTKKLIRKHFPRTFLHFMSTNISASTTLKTGLCPKMYRSYHLSLMKLLVAENPPANAGDTGDMGWIPGLGRSPEGGNGNSGVLACKIPEAEEPGTQICRNSFGSTYLTEL